MSLFAAKRQLFGALLVSLSVLPTVVLADDEGATPDICYGRENICKTPEQLKAQGIIGVRIRVQSLRRDELAGTTTWSLFAYRAGNPGNGNAATPVTLAYQLEGIINEFVQGEDQVLAAQDRICAPLLAAGLDCSRDLLDGNWFTYALGNGKAPFTVTFATTSTTPLAASGTFESKRWACRIDDLENDTAFEAEVACKGKYYTSLRLLYLTNNTYLQLSDLSCAETGRRRGATFATNGLPACDASATYAAADWQPFGLESFSYAQSNAIRVFLNGSNVALYRMGL